MTDIKPKSVNVTIVSMGGVYATGGVFLASGKPGKLSPGQVCRVSANVAKQLESVDALKVVSGKATHELVDGVVSSVSA